MLRALIRTGFAAFMRGSFGGSGKNKTAGRKLLVALLVVFVIVSLLGSLASTCVMLAPQLIEMGLDTLYFALIALMAFAVSVVATVFTASRQLYESKDNDLLLSMPIPQSYILGSRIIVLLALEYVYTLMIMLPAGVVYFVCKGAVTAGSLICLLVSFLLLPLLSLSIVCLCGWLVSLVSSKLRNKNLMTYVMTILFMVAYFAFYNGMMGDFTKLINNGVSILESIKTALPPFYSFGQAVCAGDFVQLGLLALWCVLPFALVYFVLSSNFAKIATANRGEKKKAYVRRELKTSDVNGALLRKELGRFFSLPMYVMNCGLGSIFELLLAGAAVFAGKGFISSLMGEEIPVSNTLLLAIACVFMAFCSMMDCSASCSISLEGNNLWIAKSVPAPTGSVFRAKILTNMIIGIPSGLLAAAACCAVLGASPLGWAVALLTPVVTQTFTAFFGLFANLLVPKFNWTNVNMVIKQSASVMIAVFSAMGVIGAALLLYMYVFAATDVLIYAACCLGALAVLTALLACFIFTRGKKMFERM